MALNRARVREDIGLTGGLSYLVLVDFFDSADPNTVLWTETFELPLTSTTTQLSNRVVERGQTIRAALAALAAARAAVPSGTTVTVP